MNIGKQWSLSRKADATGHGTEPLPKTHAGGSTSTSPRLMEAAPLWATLAGGQAAGLTADLSSLLMMSAGILFTVILYSLAHPADNEARGEPTELPTAGSKRWHLPYTEPDSPWDRLISWLDRGCGTIRCVLRRHYPGNAKGHRQSSWLSLAGRVVVGIPILVFLKWPAVWATLGVASLATILYLLGPKAHKAAPWIRSCSAVLIPWLLAGALLGHPPLFSALLALAYTLVSGALSTPAASTKGSGVLWIGIGAQIIVACAIWLHSNPLLAAGIVTFSLAQVAILYQAEQVNPHGRPLSLTGLWVPGMILAALAIRG